ncbi:MAG TPA: hypothetical protein VLC54_03670, partial [Anaeromyxobacter sp.]|nr:hypothetical protein [Anaeromyxobacter sp.]
MAGHSGGAWPGRRGRVWGRGHGQYHRDHDHDYDYDEDEDDDTERPLIPSVAPPRRGGAKSWDDCDETGKGTTGTNGNGGVCAGSYGASPPRLTPSARIFLYRWLRSSPRS